STQAMNASRSSFGNSGSRTRWTTTPWRSSTSFRRPPPRVMTCISCPSRTSCSLSLRTCRARPPSTIGGDSHDRVRTRPAGGRLSRSRKVAQYPLRGQRLAAVGAAVDEHVVAGAQVHREVALDRVPLVVLADQLVELVEPEPLGERGPAGREHLRIVAAFL